MTKFSDEERATIMAEAKATLARAANLKVRERPILPDDGDALMRCRLETATEKQTSAMVYKTYSTPAMPAAPTPVPDSDDGIADERQFIFVVVAEALAEIDAHHRAEIQSLKDEVADLKKAFFRTPHSMVESARELSAQTDKVLAAITELRASEREKQRRSDPVFDLPALRSH